jgi:hypothetical protein
MVAARNEDMPHVGTLDVDLGLDAEALGDGEYATLIDALRGMAISNVGSFGAFSSFAKFPLRMAALRSTSLSIS